MQLGWRFALESNLKSPGGPVLLLPLLSPRAPPPEISQLHHPRLRLHSGKVQQENMDLRPDGHRDARIQFIDRITGLRLETVSIWFTAFRSCLYSC